MERFLIEKIRVNTYMNLFGMNITQAEVISFILIIAGIILLVRLKPSLPSESADIK
jgi:prolipoprotein diacylglyceryltransferase